MAVNDGDKMQDSSDLYKCMMKAIQTKHSRGNAIRYFKLPMILLDSRLYGGAIGQFYLLTHALEEEIHRRVIEEKSEMITLLKEQLGLKAISAGYETDLKQLFGNDWEIRLDTLKVSATEKYIKQIKNSTDIELCSIAFILYGALVVGGGKATQRKAKKVIKSCDHTLFDISDNMFEARKKFKETFRLLGKQYPSNFDDFVMYAQKYMGRNNEVVLSIRCIPYWWPSAVGIFGSLLLGYGLVAKS